MGRPMRVADILVRALSAAGVRHVFGVGGANIEDLYDAIHCSAGLVEGVVAKHEFSAVTMADGYSRAGNRLGVVAATSGGGAMNLVAGLAEAHASRVPVLALVGQPPTNLEGRGAFQDTSGLAGSLDAHRLFSAVSRFCARVIDPARITDTLDEAIVTALTAPQGPVVLLLPKDVQQAVIDAPAPGRPPASAPAAGASEQARASAVAVLRAAAGKTLIIAGAGVARAGARTELAQLAERLGAWVAVAPDAKDVYDNRDARFAGVAGVMGHPNVMDCLRRASVCLFAGTRAPVMTRGGLDAELAGKTVVCFDPEPPYVSGARGVHVRGELRTALRQVTARLDPVRRPCPSHDGPRPLPVAPAARGRISQPGTMSYRDAVAAIDAAAPEDAHVFVDAGNAAAAAIHLLPARLHGRFVVAVGMGGMGYTFGAGIGAALATGRRTFVLAGDGAFFMHGMEVHTAVEYGAPVTFVIFNNNAHAMCVTREELYYGGGYSYNRFQPADIAGGVAALFPTLPTSRPADAIGLRAALDYTGRGPAFVAMDFDPEEIPPFAPFLTHPSPATDLRAEREAHDGFRPARIG